MSAKKPIYKRKWFIALVALFVLGAIGSALGSGESTTTEDSATTETTESAPPAPKDEAAKVKFKDQVLDPCLRGVARYDELGAQYLDLADRMASGQTDIYSAYAKLQELEEEYNRLAEVFRNLYEIDSFTDEDTEAFNSAKFSLEGGARIMAGAMKDLYKALDKGELSPSTAQKIADSVSSSEAEMTIGVSGMMDLAHTYGITSEKIQQ